MAFIVNCREEDHTQGHLKSHVICQISTTDPGYHFLAQLEQFVDSDVKTRQWF